MLDTPAKTRTNITVSKDLLKDARAHGLNVSAITEAALREAVRTAKAEAWRRENAEAIAEHKAYYENNNPPLWDVQAWKPDV